MQREIQTLILIAVLLFAIVSMLMFDIMLRNQNIEIQKKRFVCERPFMFNCSEIEGIIDECDKAKRYYERECGCK